MSIQYLHFNIFSKSRPISMKKFLLFFASVFFLVIIHSSCTQPINHSADLVLTNAKIWTGLDSTSFLQALAIRDSLIVAVGSNEEINTWIGENTQVIDLKSKLVSPGFNDAHIHFLSGSLGLTQVELSSTKSLDDVLASVSKFIEENPDKEWITGRGWQYTFFKTGLPDFTSMKLLDISKPIFIKAYDGHSAWANRKALAMAGITKNTTFNGFGQVVKDENGELTGALKEDAMSLVGKYVPNPTYDEELNALRKGLAVAASLGITSVQNANGTEKEVKQFTELLNSQELTLRYAAAFSINEETTQEQLDRFTFLKDSIGTANAFLRADAVKFMLDGVIEAHTGSMLEPYHDLPSGAVDAYGTLSMPLETYRDLVRQVDERGFRIYTHAIGDKGVRESLNAYELAAKKNNTKNRRHRIEHIETISPNDLPRFKELGVLPSMEPIHADPGTLAVWEKAIGKDRLPYSFAWNAMVENQAQLVFSSDWPAAISLNPIRGIHVAVNRRTPDGFPNDGWVVNQKISLAQALKAYTFGGAYSSFEEDRKGLLKQGFLADVIVFSDDLFEIDPMKTHEVKVVLTIVNGKVVYSKL